MFRQDRSDGRGGGTAVLVRDTIRCERVALSTGSVESTAVRIHRGNGGFVTVISAYSPPSAGLNTSDFDQILELAAQGDVLLGGDFNAKHPYWGGTDTNASGRVLRDVLLSCPDLDVCPTLGPTRVTCTASTFIDIFIASLGLPSGGIHCDRARVLDYESDHNAIELTIGGGDPAIRDPVTVYDFGKMNCKTFNRVLCRNIAEHNLPLDRNVTIREIDNCIENVGDSFRKAMEEAIPRRIVRKRGLPPLPPFILNFIREKKKLRRKLRRTRDCGRYSILKADIFNLDKIIQGAISEFESEYWAGYLRGIRVDDTTFARVKGAAGLLTRKAIPDLVGDDGGVASDDAERAEVLANSFRQVHDGNSELLNDGFRARIAEEVAPLEDPSPQLTFGSVVRADGLNSGERVPWLIRPNDIGVALRRRPNKKSCGIDGVPDIVLRKTGPTIWAFLTVVFNHCLNLSYFPSSWKKASIVPILKPGSDPKSISSYRPISILSPLGKLLETFIMGPIRDKLSDDGLLLPNQFGFVRGHCAAHALSVLSNYVAKGLNRRYVTISASLDVAKAFDTVWHDGIIHKMKVMGFESHICSMVKSFLKGRTFSVKVGEAHSAEKIVTAGVPQGSILGPILYNIFVADIPRPADGDLLLLYADDTLVASSGARASTVNRKVNAYLATLGEYFRKWGIRLNVAKSKGVIFKGKRKYLYPNSRQYIPVLRVDGVEIPITENMRYLGVIYSGTFQFYRHVDHMLAKVKHSFGMYLRVLRTSGGLSNAVKLLVYRQIIRPLLSYAFPAWFAISSHQMERIRIWERKILSSCLGIGSTFGEDGVRRGPSCSLIYESVDFERIDAYLVRCGLSFHAKCDELDNQLVRQCYDMAEGCDMQSLKYLPPASLPALDRKGLLFVDGKLLFYHRRIDTFDLLNTVYNTAQ